MKVLITNAVTADVCPVSSMLMRLRVGAPLDVAVLFEVVHQVADR
jgi:hypothetical protein